MKIKEELLKIYSAYLPYRLIVSGIHSKQLENDSSNLIKEEKLHLLTGLSNGYAIFDNSIYGNPIDQIKPTLYSMDMLTKEIEHKGERFIPIKEIELIINDYVEMDSEDSFLIGKIENGAIILGVEEMPYIVVKKLLEWHFNVFGLDESEYIKKETT